jgi:hypothetical protein
MNSSVTMLSEYLSDIEFMARNELEQEVEGAIKVIEVDAKTALGRLIQPVRR